MPTTKFQHILLEAEDGVATLTLNRPELHNAFNEEMIGEMTKAFTDLSKDPRVRVVVLTGAGASFCAGADLHWMKKMAGFTKAQNLADAKRLNQMLMSVYRCAKPVIAHVNGAAIGGGTGLVSAADIAIAEEGAVFSFSEVRLGLIPAVISPLVIRKIGEANAREYFLTAERFSAAKAQEMGLIQHHGSPDFIREKIQEKISLLKQAAPGALAAAKKLVENLFSLPLSKAEAFTTKLIAERRASVEGQEGMVAFLTKRKPKWMG